MSRTRLAMAGVLAAALAGGCTNIGDPLPPQSAEFQAGAYPQWSARDDEYRFYPGDKVKIDIRTAPELSAELTVAPDGRITLPVVGALQAGSLSATELRRAIEARYATELVDPSLTVTLTTIGSQKIFVGGEVERPGVVDLPGEIDPLQAIIMAGGWTDDGRGTHVIIMRRAPGGQLMTRVVDVRNGLARQELYDIGPMRRFDVVWVTRKAIADENLFVRQFVREALPIDFSLFYDVARF
jgi:polysaccharide export outer membrane protein